jgi:hypothetical protein
MKTNWVVCFIAVCAFAALYFAATSPNWFRQLDLAPFDGLIWPHLEGM